MLGFLIRNLASLTLLYILYSRKLEREKIFTNFIVLEPPTKGFSSKFGRAVPTYDRF